MPIVPESKDWTWVVERPCPECGFDPATVEFDRIPGLVRENAARWRPLLVREEVRERPDESTWSPLEYACHVRDVCDVFLGRVGLMRLDENPQFPDWDQNAAAVGGRYLEQDPVQVSVQLEAAADRTAAAFAAVPEEERRRTGVRGDGASFTIESLSKYFLHELVHHLRDARRR